MNARELETLLALLYTDSGFRESFLCRPDAIDIDRDGLALLADSLARTRERRRQASGSLCARLRQLVHRAWLPQRDVARVPIF